VAGCALDHAPVLEHLDAVAGGADGAPRREADEGIAPEALATHDGFQQQGVGPRALVGELQVERQRGVQVGEALDQQRNPVVAAGRQRPKFDLSHEALDWMGPRKGAPRPAGASEPENGPDSASARRSVPGAPSAPAAGASSPGGGSAPGILEDGHVDRRPIPYQPGRRGLMRPAASASEATIPSTSSSRTSRPSL